MSKFEFESPLVGQNRASGPSAQEMTPELSYDHHMAALRLAASIVAGDHPAGEYRVTVGCPLMKYFMGASGWYAEGSLYGVGQSFAFYGPFTLGEIYSRTNGLKGFVRGEDMEPPTDERRDPLLGVIVPTAFGGYCTR